MSNELRLTALFIIANNLAWVGFVYKPAFFAVAGVLMAAIAIATLISVIYG